MQRSQKYTEMEKGLLFHYCCSAFRWHAPRRTHGYRINQLGYLPAIGQGGGLHLAGQGAPPAFSVCDALTGKAGIQRHCGILYDGAVWGMAAAARLDFSGLTEPGGYYILYGRTRSETFRIGAGVYDGTADFILNYIRQQRCGYNPFLKDTCHVHDGMIVDHPTLSGKVIDVWGGYHDASDHLRYTATTANSVYQMMFAWQRAPEIYGDSHDAAGLPGSNGIPDILDEVRWGMEWLLKMNPDSGVMYNQVADDRDHQGFRLPNLDKAEYGLGPYRPVYFVTGKPQGLARFKNRTEGVASTAGKFASVFAMGAKVFGESDPALAEKLASKSADAFEFAQTDPGATQTACNVSPYFYEEDNYVDDMQLAAWELYTLTGREGVPGAGRLLGYSGAVHTLDREGHRPSLPVLSLREPGSCQPWRIRHGVFTEVPRFHAQGA